MLYYDISFGSTVSHTLQLKETDLGSFLEIGDDEINAIELDMRIRLAELQRLYKEKQKLYAKLQPKKSDREKDRVEYVHFHVDYVIFSFHRHERNLIFFVKYLYCLERNIVSCKNYCI